MIVCCNLTRRFGELVAVDNLTLEVPRGGICAFLGPNGAGKSTTLKMLTGLLRPTSGEATVAGLSVTREPRRVKERIGVLPENLGLFEDLSVEEHLKLTGAVYGLSARETRERSGQLLRVLDLEHGRHTFAGRCSHGMRKKTALAMAMLPNPSVLLLDEPFEAIDPVTARILDDVLEGAASRGVTVFFTSHILSTVERLARQIVMIRGGAVVWNSSSSELPQSLEELYFELAERPHIEELTWLGSPQS